MTTAAIAESSMPIPPLGSAEERRATWKTEPSAAMKTREHECRQLDAPGADS